MDKTIQGYIPVFVLLSYIYINWVIYTLLKLILNSCSAFMKGGVRPVVLNIVALILLQLAGTKTSLLASNDSLQVTIKWDEPNIYLDDLGKAQKKLNHQNIYFLEDYGSLPFYEIVINDLLIKNFKISEIIYEDLTPDESIIIEKNFKDIPEPILNLKYQKKKPVSHLYIPTLTYDAENNKFLKVLSFQLHYEKDDLDDHFQKRTSGLRNSVLATGNWYKFGVAEKGIYKITYDQLKKAGVPVDEINPKSLKLFGNGGGMLPQNNSEDRKQDLIENAIFISGEENDKFDEDDFILFYGQGADKIEFAATERFIKYENNIYSDSTFYFLTFDGDAGLRIPNQADLGEFFPVIEQYDEYIIHENDLYSINNSGREWFGELFNNQKSSYELAFPVEGISTNSDINIKCSFLTRSYVPSTYSLSLNNVEVGSVELGIIQEGKYTDKGIISLDSFSINTSSVTLNNQLNFNLKYNLNVTTSSAHLDYLQILYKRDLALYSNPTFFRNFNTVNNSNSTFKISNTTSASVIWDVSEPYLPKLQSFTIKEGKATFGISTSTLKEFVVFNYDQAIQATYLGQVQNQNIQGEGLYDMVIVTHQKFKAEAERLANFRSAQSQLSVKVVTVQEIYHEFSSGSKDVTAIRDYMKYLYDLQVNGEGLKYLLLFGKSSYDIKNKINQNINYVPIYSSRNSLHPIYSYSSDDYYGFLDDGEGEWIESPAGDHLMDIGIGRLPVRNEQEAKLIVDKIINYTLSPETFGPWRKEIFFIADDGDFNLHQLDANKLANLVDTSFVEYNVNKIYLDAYPKIDNGNNFVKAPEVNKAINDAIKSGSFIINYTGHGGLNKWADEGILDTQMIEKWKNFYKLPFFITATCEFGLHDDPLAQSGGEKMLVTTKGGAIGLITSSRPVFSSTNYALNHSFYNFVFEKFNGNHLTLGEIFKEVKNSSLKGSVNRNFSLLADPSMALSYPQEKIEITSIKNDLLSQETDTLKAFGKVKVAGRITENTGSIIESFNGVLHAEIFDKLHTTTTLGMPSMTFEERNSVIFRGKASVRNGIFEFDFIVPKNISYDFNKGKVSLYAFDHAINVDALGSNKNIKIGSTDLQAVIDREPPEVQLFLNDTTFKNGGVTSSNSLLLARIYDESGVSIIRNLNNKITATLNDENEFILNEFYESEIDNYQVGWISYPLDDLPKGKNTLKLSIWDTHNNQTETFLEFYVEEDAKLSLQNVINFPNPFTDQTFFQFDHNAAGENLVVTLDIYSVKGEHIFTNEHIFNTAPSTINTVSWDGRNSRGQKINEGIYIFKITVISETSGFKNQQYKRLIFKN